MSNLEAELDALVTVYVRSVREALRDYLAQHNPFAESRLSSSVPALRGDDTRTGLASSASQTRPQSFNRAPSSFDAPARRGARVKRGASSPKPTAKVRAALDRITAHLAEAGAEVRSSDLRKSLALSRPELQAATKWGLSHGILVKSGERSATSFSLAHG